jgi:hypothetical protein
MPGTADNLVRYIATAARHSIAAGLFRMNAIDVAVHSKRIVF